MDILEVFQSNIDTQALAFWKSKELTDGIRSNAHIKAEPFSGRFYNHAVKACHKWQKEIR